MKLDTLKLFASVAFVTFSVAACAADTDDASADTAQDGTDPADAENVDTAEAEISRAGGCKSNASWRAHANRVCGGHAKIDWRTAERRYRQGGEWKMCTMGAVSVKWTC